MNTTDMEYALKMVDDYFRALQAIDHRLQYLEEFVEAGAYQDLESRIYKLLSDVGLTFTP